MVENAPEINILLKASDEASSVIAKAGDKVAASLKNIEDSNGRVTNAQKEQETSTKQLALGLNNVATSAFSLYDAVDRVQDMQVSLDRANLQVKSSLNSVEDAQRRLNTAIEKYGADSGQAKAAAADLKLAQDRYQVSVERAEMLQGNMNETIARSALQIIPTAITMVDSLSRVWKNFPDMTKILSNISSKIGDVGISAKTAALGVGAFVGGFLIADTILGAIPEDLRRVAGAVVAIIAGIVAATVAWIAFHTAASGPLAPVTVGIMLTAIGVAVAGVKAAVGMKEGGVVTKPTYALIGEAGPEAVIPLERAGIGAQNITVYPTINIGNISSELDLPQVTAAVSAGIADGFRRCL